MPQVKIEIEKGNTREFLKKLIDTVMESVAEVLQLPANDTNIRLMEYENGLFFTKAPYRVLVEISLFAGRTPETKKKLFQAIVGKVSEKLNIPKEAVFILLNEQAKENWGIRGGIPANEIAFDFKVDI
jgi:4-oxalocrotonate tautomerase family enzyme